MVDPELVLSHEGGSKSLPWSSFPSSFSMGLQHWIPAPPSSRKLDCLQHTPVRANRTQGSASLTPRLVNLPLGPNVDTQGPSWPNCVLGDTIHF